MLRRQLFHRAASLLALIGLGSAAKSAAAAAPLTPAVEIVGPAYPPVPVRIIDVMTVDVARPGSVTVYAWNHAMQCEQAMDFSVAEVARWRATLLADLRQLGDCGERFIANVAAAAERGCEVDPDEIDSISVALRALQDSRA